MIEVALRLLDEYDCAERTLRDLRSSFTRESYSADSEWLNSVRAKIDAAVAVSEHTPPMDGETFIAGILERFRQARETQI